MKKFTGISLIFILPILILLAILFLGNPITMFLPHRGETEVIKNPPTEPTPSQSESPIEPIIEYKTYNEKPVKEDEIYFEKVVKVGSEYVYITSPIKVEVKNPPTLIVYSHGSNTTVSPDFKVPFMQDMQLYGKYFAKRGYVFSASSMHGMNYGSNQSIQDIQDLKEYIAKRYLIDTKINHIGFSMGGLPVLNHILKYPSDINKVALLAPVTGEYSKSQFESIRRIPIHIWHGNKDVNVPLSLSQSFQTVYNSYGFKNLNLEVIDGKGHFDIDTEKIANIYEFFKDEQ